MKIIYLFILLTFSLSAQYEKPFIEKHGISTFGKEFIFSLPSIYSNNQSVAKLILYSEINCDVNIKGNSFEYDVKLKANEKKVLLIPTEDIIFKEITSGNYLASNSEIKQNKAIEIISTQPIQCFVSHSEGFIGEVTQIFPNRILGNDYILQSYTGRKVNNNSLSPIFTISSIEDNTSLKITLGGENNTTIKLNNVSYDFGQEIDIVLNKKDVLQILNFQSSLTEFSGTRLTANNKINVISGHFCADVPNGIPACNYLLESNLPINSFGKKYYVPYLNNRLFGGLIRVYAVDKNTKVYENGVEVLSLSNSKPGLKGNSWGEFRVNEKSSSKKFSVITSNKPVGVSFLNTGANEDNSGHKPFIANLIPIDFYSKFSKIIYPSDLKNDKDSNFIKLILPAKNQRIDNEVYFRNSTSNEWFRLNEYYNNFDIYDNDYVILNDFDVNQEVEIWSERGHSAFLYGKYNQNGNSFGSNVVNSYWDLSKNDTIPPSIKIIDSLRVDSILTMNFEINDKKSNLIRYILEKESESYSEFIQDFDLLTAESNTFSSTFTITPKENILYNIYAIDEANNYTKVELGDMYVEAEEEIIIEYDSLIFDKEYLDFELVELNDSSIIELEVTSISSTNTMINNISINSDDNVFEFIDSPTLPLNIDVNEKLKLNIKYTPTVEFTQRAENSTYGKVDYGQLLIESSNTVTKFDIIGKGGVARINTRYDNNMFIDTMSFGSSHLISDDKFFIENYNISTKINGTFDLKITALNLDSLYDLVGTKVVADNILFKGELELDEENNLVEPVLIKPGERVFFNDVVEFQGTRDGSFYYKIPIVSNAINSKDLGFILFEFIVFENKHSNVKLSNDDFRIENSNLIINSENFKSHSEFSIIDLNGKRIIDKTKIRAMNIIDLSEFKNKVLFLVIVENEDIKYTKILLN